MKDLDNLRKEPQVSEGIIKFMSVTSLMALCGFIIFYINNNHHGMIIMGFVISTALVSISNLRQRKINRCLLDEIDKLKEEKNQQTEAK